MSKIDLEAIKEAIINMTQEDKDKYFPKDTKPKGWICIDEHLPIMRAMDIMSGFSEYKVCYKDGSEGLTKVSDHNTWYYYAKENNITHWYNV